MSFAFGIMLSVARLGSFIQGPIVEWLATGHSVGFALMVGFIICVACLLILFVLICIDVWAEKKDGVRIELDPNEKFNWKDIGSLKLPFWLVCGSCFVEYMGVIVYVANAEDMLLKRFGFNEK